MHWVGLQAQPLMAWSMEQPVELHLLGMKALESLPVVSIWV
jgi:hypothetical protein